MTYEQKLISDKLWENYQKFLNNKYFNNRKFRESDDFYKFQEYIKLQNSMLVCPILDYYIEYALTNKEYHLFVYLLYSPFIWELNVYRYQLSQILHHIKTNEELSGFVLSEDFDDFLIGLIFERSIAISIAHGTANSLNLWFYLGSYNLIPDLMSVEFEMDLHETLITEIVGIFYSHTNKSSEEMDDYYIVNEGFTKLAYSIYDISLNKAFQVDYTKSFLEEINEFIQYMYKNANDTIQRYFYTMNKLHQHGGLISTEYFNFYQSLFIKYGYDISDDIFPGVLMLTRILEDVVDYYITCIPMIYRYRSDNIQTVISDYLKIFHCLFGVGMHELYNIPNS